MKRKRNTATTRAHQEQIVTYVWALERLSTTTAKLMTTLSTCEMHTTTFSKRVTRFTIRTLCKAYNHTTVSTMRRKPTTPISNFFLIFSFNIQSDTPQNVYK